MSTRLEEVRISSRVLGLPALAAAAAADFVALAFFLCAQYSCDSDSVDESAAVLPSLPLLLLPMAGRRLPGADAMATRWCVFRRQSQLVHLLSRDDIFLYWLDVPKG